MRILIMGLSGSGKSTLANWLKLHLTPNLYLNADVIRTINNDWDFSKEGRLRQAKRITKEASDSLKPYVIADFIAALEEQREMFNPDFIIWMNTIQRCKYEDTNQAFEIPSKYNIRFDSFDEIDVKQILNLIKEI
jgi:adenylylsulfate kinase